MRALAIQNTKARRTLLVILGLTAALLMLSLTLGNPVFNDEKHHFKQITLFASGEFRLYRTITMIPGYHVVMYVIGSALADFSLDTLRVLHFILSLSLVVVGYRICAALNRSPEARSVQFFFFPTLFPYFFFLYTDPLSLLLVTGSLYYLLNNRLTACGILAVLSLAVRQTNVVWCAMLLAMGFLLNRKQQEFSCKELAAYAKRAWALLAANLIFVVFVALNGGIALGDKGGHVLGLYTGNIFFALLLFFFLFLPWNLYCAKEVFRTARKCSKTQIGLLAAFTLYLGTFKMTHPYNELLGFLRNEILVFLDSDVFIRMGAFVFIAYSICVLRVTVFKEKAYYLIYPFSLFALLPAHLIEQRYYIVPFTLFLFLRPEGSARLEWLSAAYNFVFALVLYSIAVLYYGYFL